MAALRIQVVVSEEERELFRRAAEREGKSLSGWMRDVAQARAHQIAPDARVAWLREFFAESDRWHEENPSGEPELEIEEIRELLNRRYDKLMDLVEETE